MSFIPVWPAHSQQIIRTNELVSKEESKELQVLLQIYNKLEEKLKN